MLREFLKNFYKYKYRTNITPESVPPPKTNREKLYDLALAHLNIDPTPKDEQPDEYACVESLTTILKKLLPDFTIMTYTPNLLVKLQSDSRFKASNELKVGNIIISPTNTGNGNIIGHCGIVGENGEILSNASSTGLWTNKFNQTSWIERYSRKGGLSLHIFELL